MSLTELLLLGPLLHHQQQSRKHSIFHPIMLLSRLWFDGHVRDRTLEPCCIVEKYIELACSLACLLVCVQFICMQHKDASQHLFDGMLVCCSYRQAQATVLEALPRLKKLNIFTKRPEDYFAEMAKSDQQMQKVRPRWCQILDDGQTVCVCY